MGFPRTINVFVTAGLVPGHPRLDGLSAATRTYATASGWYAVQQFFLNGGSQALTVRVEGDGSGQTADVEAWQLWRSRAPDRNKAGEVPEVRFAGGKGRPEKARGGWDGAEVRAKQAWKGRLIGLSGAFQIYTVSTELLVAAAVMN
jgi:hypothetical protein